MAVHTEGEKDYELRLSYRKEVPSEETRKIVSMLRDVIGEDANITVTRVDEIPVLASGKRKVVVNEWKN